MTNHIFQKWKFTIRVLAGLLLGIVVVGVLLKFLTYAAQPNNMRSLPDPLYGVTVDNVDNIGQIVDASRHFARKPITRIVFDENTKPSDYSVAVTELQPHSFLMGELADSEYLSQITTQEYHDRTAAFLTAFGDQLDLWEVGNEVNGDWTGGYGSVSEKISDAYRQVSSAGKRSALTLWYNPGCAGSSAELDPVSFSQKYLPADMQAGLDYVFISYYETQCNDYRPTAAVLTSLFTQLHQIFPNSKLGFGEIGLPNASNNNTISRATDIATYYYGLNINLSYYIGGYFYWYYYEDALPYTTKPMWQILNQLFQDMPSTSTSATPGPSSPPTSSQTSDMNSDGLVNDTDLADLLAKWTKNESSGDINHDGVINVFDLSELLSNYHSGK